ncbi:MAG: hypothetical protein ACOX5R_22820 [bacterium]|jgi:arabinofuranosyltransferase
MRRMVLQAGCVLLSLVLGGLFYFSVDGWTLDDAFISFRYAEHFADGLGLVYNPGERVEGYSTFLWVLLLSFFYRVGADTLLAAKVLGVLFSLLTLLLVLFSYRWIREITAETSLTAAFFLGSSGIFLPWQFSGMEVSMYSFLITLTLMVYLGQVRGRESVSACFILVLLCWLTALTRPEGLLLFAVLVGDQILLYCLPLNRRKLFSVGNTLILPFLFLYGGYILWRYSYYGFFLPNTFYAKVGWSSAQVLRGLHYIREFLIPALGLILPFIALLLVKRTMWRNGTVKILLVLLLLFLMYVIVVGGDSMPAFRFLAPVMPLLAILAAMSVTALSLRREIILVYVAGGICFNMIITYWDWDIHQHILSDRVAHHGREVGLWLKERVDDNTVIATNAAGSIPYYSGLRAIDMLGLNDLHIAHQEKENMGQGSAGHEKTDGQYILSRKPDIIQFGSSLGLVEPLLPSDHEIRASSEFVQEYEMKTFGNLPSGKDLTLYLRRGRQIFLSSTK